MRYLLLLLAPLVAAHAHAATPSVTGDSPNAGPLAGGNTVTISGSGLTGATAVNFGPFTASSFTVVSDDDIEAVAPPSPVPGETNVSVTTLFGTSESTTNNLYSYVPIPSLFSVTPTGGAPSGGTVVAIMGSNFSAVTTVHFGAIPSPSVNVVNDSNIVATAPAQLSGTVDITVTSPGGTSSTSPSDQFTYAATPVVLQGFGVD